jgi:hypothetical protein
MVGREDLARAYHRRHVLMISGYAVAGAAFVVAGAIYFQRASYDPCDLPRPQRDECVDNRGRSQVPAIIAGGVAVAGGLFGTYFARNPHPIDVNDAKTLADAYNQRLRGQLGLPVASRAPVIRELALLPYIAGAAGGLVLGGRF